MDKKHSGEMRKFYIDPSEIPSFFAGNKVAVHLTQITTEQVQIGVPVEDYTFDAFIGMHTVVTRWGVVITPSSEPTCKDCDGDGVIAFEQNDTIMGGDCPTCIGTGKGTLKEQLIAHYSDLNRYDDDEFTWPEGFNKLTIDEAASLQDWADNLLRRGIRNALDHYIDKLQEAAQNGVR